MKLLEIENLSAHYGDFPALRAVSLTLSAEQTLAVVGANGAGKSTLLRSICGLHERKSGRLEFLGRGIDRLPAHEIVALGISMVPEGRRLFASLDVEENIVIGQHVRRPGEWTLARIYQLFPRLAERRHHAPAALSGGEQQMAAIARALMANPALLICDELSLGLAPAIIKDLYAQLDLIRRGGTGLIIVEQDVGRALATSDQVICLTEGRVTLSGPTQGMTRAAISAAYFKAGTA